MKKHQSYLVLLFALLLSGAMQAKVNNYVGVYAQAGEWTLNPSKSEYGPSFGVAGGAGFLYELQAGRKYSPTRFLLDLGVGAWGGMTSYIQGSNMLVELKNQVDLQGEQFDYIYQIENRHDSYKNIAVQVPLMVGVQHNKFYMLAGVKVDANIFTRSVTTANLTTYGRYNDFYNFYNMPEYQFFNDEKIVKPASPSLKLNLNVCLEVGGRLGLVTNAIGFDVPKRKTECRIAGFVDYGISDIHTSRELAGFDSPQVYDTNPSSSNYVYNTRTMVQNLTVNDLMSTKGFASKVNSMVVGVKFTVLFQLPEEGQCVLCRDAYRSEAKSGRGGRGVQYEE